MALAAYVLLCALRHTGMELWNSYCMHTTRSAQSKPELIRKEEEEEHPSAYVPTRRIRAHNILIIAKSL